MKTLVHSNSVESFYAGRMDLFSQREREILAVLRDNCRPMTDRQICVALKQADPNYARPRITDLLHRGVLVEDGTTFDEATRRTVRRLAIAPYQSRLELIA